MRILIVNSFYFPEIGGGAELTVLDIAEGLSARGHEVHVVCTKDRGCSETRTQNGVYVHRLPIRNIYWHFRKALPNRLVRAIWHWFDRSNRKAGSDFSRILEKAEPQVVMIHNLAGFSTALWAEVSARRLPLVQVLHDLYVACPSSSMFNRGRRCRRQCLACAIFRLGVRGLSRQVSHVIGVSAFVVIRLKELGFFIDVPSSVIYNCIQIQAKHPKIAERELVFGYIGNLTPSKGVDLLIKELPHDVDLRIAGSGSPEYTLFLRELGRRKKITYVGHVSPDDFFPGVDVCVIPSRWEEVLGRVAIEACANHTAIIASRRGGLTEIVQPMINGLDFDPDKSGDLTSCIEQMRTNPRMVSEMQSRARASVEHLLEAKQMVGHYEEVLSDLIRLEG